MSATVDVTYAANPPIIYRYVIETEWAQLDPPSGTHPSLHLPRSVLNQGPDAIRVSAHPDPNGGDVIPPTHSAVIQRPGILWGSTVP